MNKKVLLKLCKPPESVRRSSIVEATEYNDVFLLHILLFSRAWEKTTGLGFTNKTTRLFTKLKQKKNVTVENYQTEQRFSLETKQRGNSVIKRRSLCPKELPRRNDASVDRLVAAIGCVALTSVFFGEL